MQNLNTVLRAIPAPDTDAMARAQQHIDGLLKPPGSFGRLEALAVQLAGMPGLGGQPQVAKKALLVMCADHGVWDEGVAISPKAVTAIQAANMTRGTTGVCVLAAQAGAKVHVIDVGIDSEPLPGVVNMRVARGCGNIARGPAMSREQGQELLLEVMRYTRALAQEGVTLFGVGELGMANTTPAAAIVSVLTGSDAQEVVGIGANLPLAKVGNKVEVVRRAIAVNQPDPNDGLDVLSKVGGFDLLGMTGVMLGAASCGLPVVLDGFLSYAAALAACQIAPEVKPYLIPSHYSAEKGRVSRWRTWVSNRISIWACVWEKAAARRWRCRSSRRPARCTIAWACWRQAILCYRRGKQEMGAAMAVPVFGRGFAGGRNKKHP